MESDVDRSDTWQALTNEVHRRLGRGAALQSNVRRRFEGRLGGDLSGAMIHRSPLAGYLAQALGTHAFTTGQHVVGGDNLDPSTTSGAALLGHELTHTLQRDVDATGEAAARETEQRIASEYPAEPVGIDAEALTDRVYRLLVDQLTLERERAGGVA